MRRPLPPAGRRRGRPSSSTPAPRCRPAAWPAAALRARPSTRCRRAGYRVVVTGGPGERALTAAVAGRRGVDLGGRTDLAAAGRAAGRRRGRRGRQHRPPRTWPPPSARRWCRCSRPVVPGGAVGALRRAARAARRPGRRLPGHPGAGVPGARPPLPDVGDRSRCSTPCARSPRRKGGAGVRILHLARARILDDGVRAGPARYLVPVMPDRGPEGLGRARTWDWPASAPRGDARAAARRAARRRRPAAARELDLVRALAGPASRAATCRRSSSSTTPPAGRRPATPAPAGRPRRHPDRARDPLQPLFWDNGARPHRRSIEHGIVDPG